MTLGEHSEKFVNFSRVLLTSCVGYYAVKSRANVYGYHRSGNGQGEVSEIYFESGKIKFEEKTGKSEIITL